MTSALARGALRALAFPALAVVLLVGAPRLVGWETYALGSGSMEPASGLSGDAVADGIALAWTASPSANVQYLVERCMGPGCTTFAALTVAPGTSYLDETVDRRTWYGYRVAASYAGWTSAYPAAVWVRAR